MKKIIKMRNMIVFSIFTILIISCKEKNLENELTNNNEKLEIEKLSDNLLQSSKQIDSIQNELDSINNYLQNFNTSIENEEIWDLFFYKILDINKINSHSWSKTQSVLCRYKMFESGWRLLDYGNKSNDFLANLLNDFIRKNRDSDIIELIYSRNRKFILAILTKPVYESSGMSNIVKSLLIAHDDLKGQNLNELYIQATKERPNYEKYKKFISKRVVDLLSGNDSKKVNFPFHDELWCYSFWVRRYSEKNMTTVYKILKDIDNSIK